MSGGLHESITCLAADWERVAVNASRDGVQVSLDPASAAASLRNRLADFPSTPPGGQS